MSTRLFSILQSASSTMEMQQVEAPSPAVMMVVGLIFLGLLLVTLAAVWKIFTKAGEPGWAVIVPFYNLAVMMKVSGKPWWWFLLLLIPVVGIVIAILQCVGLAKNFGKGTGFAIGLILLSPIFILILGFGSAQFQGTKG